MGLSAFHCGVGAFTALVSSGLLVPAQAHCILAKTPMPGLKPAPAQWQNDAGPLLQQYVDLRYKQETVPSLQGVDLSKYQPPRETDYDGLVACGTQFAILKYRPRATKLSEKATDPVYASHSRELRRRGITVMTYFWLEPPQTAIALYEAISDKDLRVARDRGFKSAVASFAQYRREFGHDLEPSAIGGLNGVLVAVDAETLPTGEGKAVQKRNYGRYYGALLAGWVDGARSVYRDAQVILYTGPSVYVNYIAQAEPQDYAKIYGLPIWIARPQDGAGDIELTKAEVAAARNKAGRIKPGAVWTQRMCLSANYNKCVIQQYSQRAMFGMKHSPGRDVETCRRRGFDKCWPNHVDVNRLYPVTLRQSDKAIIVARAYDPRLMDRTTVSRDHVDLSLFVTGGAAFTPEGRQALTSLAESIGRQDVETVLVTARAETNAGVNGSLARARAQAVTDLLTANGVSLRRVAAHWRAAADAPDSRPDDTVSVDIFRPIRPPVATTPGTDSQR